MQTTRKNWNFLHRSAIAVTLASVAAAILLLVWSAAQVFLVLFAGILFAILLRGLVKFIRMWIPIPVWGAFILVVLLVFGAATGMGVLFADRVAEQANELIERIPAAEKAMRSGLEQHAWGRRLLEITPSPDKAISLATQTSAGVTGIFSGTLGALANAVVILFLGLYMAARPEEYRENLIRLFPPSRRNRCREVLLTIFQKLLYWLMGRVASMVIVFVATCTGLWLIGVPAALALGLLAGILNFIPNIGPLMSAIPAALMAWTVGPTQVAYVALLYLVVQLLESYVLTPLLDKQSVKLAPALTISMQLLFGVLVGFWGLALATPLTATAVVLIQQLYLKKLEDE